MPFLADHDVRMRRTRLSLDGLSVGDAFGERFFQPRDVVEMLLARRAVPKPPWRWTDDTAMAISIVEELDARGGIAPDALAERFARRYVAQPDRGYGGGAHRILSAIAEGIPYEEAARAAFGGEGSMGNGAAMRAAPIGAYFADDLAAVVAHARASADPTHAHPEGAAGAVAVAVAAALSARADRPRGRAFLEAVATATPPSATRDGVVEASALAHDLDVRDVAERLGSGSRVLSIDTVPFSLYCAAHHLDDYEEALWATVAGLGDRDTTCAIVGGVVALATRAIPAALLEAREPLPA